MKTLSELRRAIDAADRQIAAAYRDRIALTKDVGALKKETGTEVLQTARETEVLENAVRAAGEENRTAVSYLFREIMENSKLEQRVIAGAGNSFLNEIRALPKKDRESGAVGLPLCVACQGAEGAYSDLAAKRLFDDPHVTFCKSFRDVFVSVSQNECAYGVLPIENSTAGSVNEVYDLLEEFGLKIAGATKMKIAHCILGIPGAVLEKIGCVSSHPQALSQCRKTLDELKIMNRFAVSNTAVAAREVALKGDLRAAAIASQETAKLYGLSVLKRDAQDADRNFTRFIVIAAEPFVAMRGNRISLIVSIDHKEGALKGLLAIFSEYGKNLRKLESRPIPNKDFEFLFYVDLEADAGEPDTREMLLRVGAYCNTAVFLGGYRED